MGMLHPILAAADIVHLIFGLVALVFLVMRQLFEANKQAGAKKSHPSEIPPQPPVAAETKATGQQADALRAQVEELLRRSGKVPNAAQPAAAAQRSAQSASPREIQLRVVTPPAMSTPPPSSPRRSSAPLPSQTAAGREKSRSRRSSLKSPRKSVAEHVAEQVTASTQSIAEKAAQLGQRIAAEDQQFDVMLKAKFDHTIGTLAESRATTSADNTPVPEQSPAAQIAAMMANPNGIRQAVLINEILHRPSDRW